MADKLKGGIIGGSTDLSIPVILRKTADNTEYTGLTDGSILASYWRQGGVRVSITMTSLAAANSAHADGGWVEVHSTAMAGVYRLDVPDAAIASAADWVVFSAKVVGASSYLWVQEYTLTGDPASSLGFANVIVNQTSIAANVTLVKTDVTSLVAAIVAVKVDTASSLLYVAANNTSLISIAANITTVDGVVDLNRIDVTSIVAAVAAVKVDTASSLLYVTANKTSLVSIAANIVTLSGTIVAGLAALNDITVAEVWAQVIDTLVAPSLVIHADDALMWAVAYISGNVAKASTAFAYANGAGATLWTNDIAVATRTRS